jgi:hypothetical protein
MDTSSIAGSSLLLRTAQSQQALSTAMVKQAADQQNKMAELLAQNARQAPRPAANSAFNFSIFA